MNTTNPIQLQLLFKENDLRDLQEVLEGAPRYSLKVSGQVQPSTASEEVFVAIPEGFDVTKKIVIGVKQDTELIGVIDILRGFPNEETAMLGLLLLKEKKQGQGLGKRTFEELLTYVSSWSEIHKIRISVVKSNDEVLIFWKKLGFIETGVNHPYENGSVISESIVLEKILNH